jgi:hypothetical protein
MFGKKGTGNESTVLLSGTELPKIISFQREPLPLTPSLFSGELTRGLEKSLGHSLKYTREVAAHMRVHAPAAGLGQVSKAVVFLAAPWGVPNLTTRGPEYLPGMREFIKREVEASFGDIPVTFFTSADALAFGSKALGRHVDALVTALRGEMIELLLMDGDQAKGYSTLPLGSRSVLRTLQTHGALSKHEASSILTLANSHGHAYEPLTAAGRNLSEHFANGVKLLLPAGSATKVVVVAEHPMGEWFAQHLAEDPKVSDLFSENSIVEAIRPHHLGQHLSLGAIDDPFIMLESIFVDARS